jgi:hypothetical protein
MSYLTLFITLILASAVCAAPTELIRKIEPLSVRGVNYFPRDTPWDKMWTETPTEVWEKDMAAAAKLGVNTVRKTINTQRMNQTVKPLIIGEFGMCTSRDPQHGTSAELISKLNDNNLADQNEEYFYLAISISHCFVIWRVLFVLAH